MNSKKKLTNKKMKAVKSKDSKIELKLRKELWKQGYRYRKHYKKVKGSPDIAFVGLKIAIFCDSEFWHGKDWQERKKDFKSNIEFWHKKIEYNMELDRRVNEELQRQGWLVLRFWGNDISSNTDNCIKRIEQAIIERRLN